MKIFCIAVFIVSSFAGYSQPPEKSDTLLILLSSDEISLAVKLADSSSMLAMNNIDTAFATSFAHLTFHKRIFKPISTSQVRRMGISYFELKKRIGTEKGGFLDRYALIIVEKDNLKYVGYPVLESYYFESTKSISELFLEHLRKNRFP